jgi:hypothetical protein
MKKFLALMLVIMMVFTIGCITDSGDDGGDNKDNGDNGDNGGNGSGTASSAETYLPFKTGATWSYTETSTSYWGETPDVSTSTSTVTCTGTSTQNAKTYWTLKVADESGWGSEFYMRIDGNNVYVYDPNWVFKISPAKKKVKQGQPAMKKAINDDEVLMFKFNQSAGHSWAIEEDSDTGEGYSYTYKSTGKFYGLENVTTSAGTFANCARFDETIIDSSTHAGQSYSSTTTISRWLAPGVGHIKENESFVQDGETVELFETECTTYDVTGTGGGGDGEDDLYTISGQITDSSGDGIEGVLVDATAEIDGEDVYGNETTDAQGNYTIDRCAEGTWTIEPYHSSYDFNPESKDVVVDGANVTGVSFAEADDSGIAPGYEGDTTVQGSVVDESGAGVEGIRIVIKGSVSGNVVMEVYTNSAGDYIFENILDALYDVIVYSESYTFVGDEMKIVNTGSNNLVTVEDFVVSGGGGDGGGGNGGGVSGASWQPLTDDSQWEWSEVTHNADGDELYSDTYTIVSDLAITKNGVDYQLMDNYDEWDDPYYRFEGDILYIWWDDDGYIWFKPAAVKADEGQAFPYYNFGATVGEEWLVFEYEDDDEDMTITCVGKYLGTEDVIVQAGSFAGCAKMQLTYTKLHNYTDLFSGIEKSELIVLISTHWFAQGVGEVMVHEARSIDGILSDITEKEVTSYTIQ